MTWTPITTALPPLREPVLVTLEDTDEVRRVTVGSYNGVCWQGEGVGSRGHVIAWAPLPEPYLDDYDEATRCFVRLQSEGCEA